MLNPRPALGRKALNAILEGAEGTVSLPSGLHLILQAGPHHELRQVSGEYKLTEWLSAAPDGQVGSVLLGKVALVHQARRNVSVLDGVIIVRAEDVSGDYGEVVATMLFVVTSTENLNHPLGVRIAFVGRMGRPVMQLILGYGIFDLVRKHTGRGHAHDPIYTKSIGTVEDIVIDCHIFDHHFNLRIFVLSICL